MRLRSRSNDAPTAAGEGNPTTRRVEDVRGLESGWINRVERHVVPVGGLNQVAQPLLEVDREQTIAFAGAPTGCCRTALFAGSGSVVNRPRGSTPIWAMPGFRAVALAAVRIVVGQRPALLREKPDHFPGFSHVAEVQHEPIKVGQDEIHAPPAHRNINGIALGRECVLLGLDSEPRPSPRPVPRPTAPRAFQSGARG